MILSSLREQTRTQHERLEVRLDILNLTRSLDQYRALLERMYGFYAPMEKALAVAAVPLMGGDWEASRQKLPRLSQDLIALGNTPSDIRALPLCAELPALDTPARTLGCLYVLEGATLGGQIISRHLREAHGLSEENGAAFFRGYGPETGRLWKSFGNLLTEQVVAQRWDEAEVIAGARDTFIRYEAWVCSPQPAVSAKSSE